MGKSNLDQMFALEFLIGEDGPYEPDDTFTIGDILSDQKKVLKGGYHSSPENGVTITLDCGFLHKYLIGHGFEDEAKWDQQDEKFCLALVKGISTYFQLNNKAYEYAEGDDDDMECYADDPEWGVEPTMLYVGDPEDELEYDFCEW